MQMADNAARDSRGRLGNREGGSAERMLPVRNPMKAARESIVSRRRSEGQKGNRRAVRKGRFGAALAGRINGLKIWKPCIRNLSTTAWIEHCSRAGIQPHSDRTNKCPSSALRAALGESARRRNIPGSAHAPSTRPLRRKNIVRGENGRANPPAGPW